MPTWNHVVLGDGTRAVLVPGPACINRIVEADGHRSCDHTDAYECDRAGHTTISMYEVIREGEPGWWEANVADAPAGRSASERKGSVEYDRRLLDPHGPHAFYGQPPARCGVCGLDRSDHVFTW